MATARDGGGTKASAHGANMLAARHKPLVKRVVAAAAARGAFERVHKDELVTDVLKRTVTFLVKQPDANPEAVARWHLRRAVTDLWRTRATRIDRQNVAVQGLDLRPVRQRSAPVPRGRADDRDAVLTEELTAVLVTHVLDENDRREAARTSFRAIQGEQMRRTKQLLRMTLALITTPEDQDMFLARFVRTGREVTLQELADTHGIAVGTVFNRLRKSLGLFEFVAAHFHMLDEVILIHFVERLEKEPTRAIPLEELLRSASNYARMQAELSVPHAEIARDIVTHMDWIRVNLPQGRAGMAGPLRRLAEATGRYVLDKDDAIHDVFAVRGLHDDRRVARQVRLAVRDATRSSRSA
jgi:hypothetical protein